MRELPGGTTAGQRPRGTNPAGVTQPIPAAPGGTTRAGLVYPESDHMGESGFQWAVTKLIEMIGPKRLRSLTASDVEKAFRETDFARESYIKIRSVLGKALDHVLRRGLGGR